MCRFAGIVTRRGTPRILRAPCCWDARASPPTARCSQRDEKKIRRELPDVRRSHNASSLSLRCHAAIALQATSTQSARALIHEVLVSAGE
jgi:hypothetical protein